MKNKLCLFDSLLGETLLLSEWNVNSASVVTDSAKTLIQGMVMQPVRVQDTGNLAAASGEPMAASQTNIRPQAASAASNGYIGESRVLQTALSCVSGGAANNIHIYTDYDYGWMVYEGKIIHNVMEYGFAINPAIGQHY